MALVWQRLEFPYEQRGQRGGTACRGSGGDRGVHPDVPALQWAVLLAGLYGFQTALGRLPDGFSLGGTAQRNSGVLMHAFVVFVLMLASLVFTEVCLPARYGTSSWT
jgi:hypothetical protein